MNNPLKKSMNNLPAEILLSIFLRSDVDTVLECKVVCKPWCKLIRNQIMKNKSSANTHLAHRKSLLPPKPDENDPIRSGFLWLRKSDNRHDMLIPEDKPMGCTLHYAEYDVDAKNKSYGIKSRIINILPIKQTRSDARHLVNLSSCNGLICAALPHHKLNDPTYVFNPVTREYVNLPMYDQSKGSPLVYNMVSGFGYSPSTDEYKVVRSYCKGNGSRWFQVFILGGDNWKEEKEIQHQLFHNVGPCSKGVSLDGKIHWLDKESRIVAFSIANEEFYHIDSPPLAEVDTYRYHNRKTLSVLGDWLCLAHSQSDGVDIWLLKKNNDGTWSWNKEFTVKGETKPHYPGLVPLAVTKQGKVLFWQNERYVSCYDPETAMLERLWKDEIGYEDVDVDVVSYQAAPHINSFVSLKALGVKKCRRRIEYEV